MLAAHVDLDLRPDHGTLGRHVRHPHADLEAGPAERLRPFRLTGPGIPRAGNAIAGGGVVTSGTLSPCLDVGVGLGYLPADRADAGTAIEIDVRGKTREAVVAERPLYSKERDG